MLTNSAPTLTLLLTLTPILTNSAISADLWCLGINLLSLFAFSCSNAVYHLWQITGRENNTQIPGRLCFMNWWRHNNKVINHKKFPQMFRIKFPTKRIFWIFTFGKLTERRSFVTYLWNNPRTSNEMTYSFRWRRRLSLNWFLLRSGCHVWEDRNCCTATWTRCVKFWYAGYIKQTTDKVKVRIEDLEMLSCIKNQYTSTNGYLINCMC